MAHNLPAIPALSPRHDPMRLFVSADLWQAAALLLSSFVVGTVWFAVLASLLTLSLFEGAIVTGLPFLVFALAVPVGLLATSPSYLLP